MKEGWGWGRKTALFCSFSYLPENHIFKSQTTKPRHSVGFTCHPVLGSYLPTFICSLEDIQIFIAMRTAIPGGTQIISISINCCVCLPTAPQDWGKPLGDCPEPEFTEPTQALTQGLNKDNGLFLGYKEMRFPFQFTQVNSIVIRNWSWEIDW